MTAPFDLSDIATEPIPADVPNHRASSGESGDPSPLSRAKRAGIFGGGRSTVSPVKPPKEAPPKLSPGMRKNLEDFYSFIGATVRTFDEFTGDTIIEQAPKCAKSVYDLAQSNDSVRRAVIALTTTTVTGAVIMAHLPIILAVARHSNNERIKFGAMSGMMAMKFADADTVEKEFGPKEDEPA